MPDRAGESNHPCHPRASVDITAAGTILHVADATVPNVPTLNGAAHVLYRAHLHAAGHLELTNPAVVIIG